MRRRVRSIAPATIVIEAHVPEVSALLGAAGQLHDVPDQRRQLVELLDHVGAQRVAILGREQALVAHELQVGADRGDRGAELVRGVGHQVALRLHRLLERVEGAVEGLRQPRQLVAAVDVESLLLQTLGVERDRLGLTGEAGDRRQRRACHQQPQQGGDEDPGRGDQGQEQQLVAQGMVDVAQGERDEQRPAPADPGRQHPDRRCR